MRSLSPLGAVLLFTILGTVGCDSPDVKSGAPGGEGRTRLSVNDSSASFGEYEIHVNAMSTADLTPEVARNYGITRSENTALINLVVLKSDGGEAGKPVTANVSVSAANLTGQLKGIEMQEITDAESIYYIGVLSVDDREAINFDFDVQPAGSNRLLLLRFSHEFYTKS